MSTTLHETGSARPGRDTARSLQNPRGGSQVLFANASQWIDRLAEAHQAGRLHPGLARPGRYSLLIIDEAGYIPFEHKAANLFFQLIPIRYEFGQLVESGLTQPPIDESLDVGIRLESVPAEIPEDEGEPVPTMVQPPDRARAGAARIPSERAARSRNVHWNA